MDGFHPLRQIQVADALQDRVRLGVVGFKSLHVAESRNAALDRAIGDLGEEVRRSLGDRRPSSLRIVERTRRLYHQCGLDPTKHRPSSEKLLRRVLRDKPFPAVNSFVDAQNLVSLKLQFPLGIYDWDCIVPPILLRIGTPSERFIGVAGDEIGLAGKLVLVDGEGPFGNPTQDSQRTVVSTRTVRALVLAFAPSDVSREELNEVIDDIRRHGEEYNGGQVVAEGILP